MLFLISWRPFSIIKGHWPACACDVLGRNSLEEHILLPTHTTDMEKRLYIESIAKKVVDRFGVVRIEQKVLKVWIWAIQLQIFILSRLRALSLDLGNPWIALTKYGLKYSGVSLTNSWGLCKFVLVKRNLC